jgi:hypothetical protein
MEHQENDVPIFIYYFYVICCVLSGPVSFEAYLWCLVSCRVCVCHFCQQAMHHECYQEYASLADYGGTVSPCQAVAGTAPA